MRRGQRGVTRPTAQMPARLQPVAVDTNQD